jgi:hypothetical protein
MTMYSNVDHLAVAAEEAGRWVEHWLVDGAQE